FACDETPELMPLPIMLAHRLARRLAEVRRNKTLSYLRPDGKVQVTVRYGDDGRPAGVDNVVVSTQHHDEVAVEQLRADITEHVTWPRTSSPRGSRASARSRCRTRSASSSPWPSASTPSARARCPSPRSPRR